MKNTDFKIHLIHTDSSFVVVDKPGGLLSVPGRGPDKQDCVVKRIKELFPQCIAQPAVHRLDMQTSGLMVLALTRDSHRCLSRQFENRQVTKRYHALLQGDIDHDSGWIKLRFRLDPDNRPLQIHDPIHGKTGITHWKKLAMENSRARIEFSPLTGRTHQLRLHAAHPLGLGCPIIGDRLYGNGQEGDTLLLHATYLSFHHPLTGDIMEFTSSPDF